MHGQYVRNIDRQLISEEEDTFLWLSKGDLKAETESEIVACPGKACILCAVLCTAHNMHAIPRHAATPPHNK
jgi:hypothetical protein